MSEYVAGVTDKDLISQLPDNQLRMAIRRTRLQSKTNRYGHDTPQERKRVAKARRYMQVLKAELKSRKAPTKKTTKKASVKRKAPKRRTLKRKASGFSKKRAAMVLSKLKKDGFYLDAAGKVTASDDLYMSQK